MSVPLDTAQFRALAGRLSMWDDPVGSFARDVLSLLDELDEARQQVDAASAILGEAERILPGVITTAGRFALDVTRERCEAAERRCDELRAVARAAERFTASRDELAAAVRTVVIVAELAAVDEAEAALRAALAALEGSEG